MMLLPGDVPVKLVPPITLSRRLPSEFCLNGSCHCTPISLAVWSETSAITASISTCARRTSSWRTTAASERNTAGGALMISALFSSCAWIVAGDTPPAPAASPPLFAVGGAMPVSVAATPCRIGTRSFAFA